MSSRVTETHVILDHDKPAERTTWPRPDDPLRLAWKLTHAHESMTEPERLLAARYILAYSSLCLHPARTQKTAGRTVRRIGRAVADDNEGCVMQYSADYPCPCLTFNKRLNTPVADPTCIRCHGSGLFRRRVEPEDLSRELREMGFTVEERASAFEDGRFEGEE